MSSTRRTPSPPFLALCLVVGTAVGYLTHSTPPVATRTPDLVAPTPPTPEASLPATLHREISRSMPSETPAAAAPPSAGFPPLPPPGPIRAHLDALRERARLGDRAAARRAHRDLQACTVARSTQPHLRDEQQRARLTCVAGVLCAGLESADLAEAGAFLMRAAELGDPDAMAAVADGLAVDGTAAGIRRLPATRALASAYLQRALEAGSPIAMMTLVGGLCPSADPLQSIFHHRDFSPEERLAWFHAIRPLIEHSSRQQLPLHCAEEWTAEAAARAERRGRALYAQHYSARRSSMERDWQRARAELGFVHLQDVDPGRQGFPECPD